ncbi:MAG TPA: hypothetical protein VJU59_19565 [Paraburkholderia sp.]|nr:hypothetical protein [Paraburkholderia sp.]HKR41837.1 hypothetical protein [Paraburkholderia sp.]
MAYPLCSGSEGAFAVGKPAAFTPPLDGAAQETLGGAVDPGETILV